MGQFRYDWHVSVVLEERTRYLDKESNQQNHLNRQVDDRKHDPDDADVRKRAREAARYDKPLERSYQKAVIQDRGAC